MVVAVSFNKRIPPGAASRGTLAELMAKSKAAADARASAQAPVETPTIMQGLGHVAQVISGGIQEGRALRSESEARDALAKIQATVGLEGATPAQLAEIGRYDPEIAQQYREEAVQARRDAAARAEAARLHEDTQAFTSGERVAGQEFTSGERKDTQGFTSSERRAGEAFTSGERKAGEAFTHGERVGPEGTQEFQSGERRAGEAFTSGEREAGEAFTHGERVGPEGTQAFTSGERKAEQDFTLQQDAAKAEAELKVAKSEVGKIMQDFNNGIYGDPNLPQSRAARDAALTSIMAKTKGLSVTVDKDGNISVEQGGTAEGDPYGSRPDIENQANASQVYIDQAKAANDALPSIDAMEKSLGNVGYTGPGGDIYGAIDDALQGAQSTVGIPKDYQLSLPGDPAARAIMDVGGLQQTLQHVQSTKGAVSDAEMGLFKQASAGLGKNPEANAIIIKMARAIINRANERATKAQAYAAANGGRITGFEQTWNAYINDNPIIGVDKNGMPVVNDGGTQPAQPDATAPEKPVSEMTDAEIDAAIAAEEKRKSGR